MKKLFNVFILIFVSIMMVGCFITEDTTIKFVKVPNSLYKVGADEDNVLNTVSISINGGPAITLAEALEHYGDDITVTGLNFETEGTRTLSVKYRSVTIYYQYTVVGATVNIPTVTPDTTWYNAEDTLFVIETIEELYGLAKLVNDKTDDFEGKTIKLDADIDLTSAVWIPIGEGVRKGLKTSTPNTDMADAIAELDDDFAVYGTPDPTSGRYLDKEENELPENYALIADENGTGDLVGFVHFDGTHWTAYQNEGVTDPVTESVFKGTFDGQNHTIKGLSDIGYNPQDIAYYYSNSYTLVKGYVFGLFGRASGNAVIKNIKMTDVAISGTYFDGNTLQFNYLDSAGAILGYYQGLDTGSLTIENCEVLSGGITGYDAVGGITGRVYNALTVLIKDCKNYVPVFALRKSGGMTGYAGMITEGSISFTNCINYGNISMGNAETGDASNAGGMVSYVGSAATGTLTFTNCINYGNVTSYYGTNNAGGIVSEAYCKDSAIINYNSYSYGTITIAGEVKPNDYGVPTLD